MFIYFKIQIFQNLNSITDVFLVLQAFLKSYLLLRVFWGLLSALLMVAEGCRKSLRYAQQNSSASHEGFQRQKDFKMKVDFHNSDGSVNYVMVFLYFIQQMPKLNAVSSYLMRETSRLTWVNSIVTHNSPKCQREHINSMKIEITVQFNFQVLKGCNHLHRCYRQMVTVMLMRSWCWIL